MPSRRHAMAAPEAGQPRAEQPLRKSETGSSGIGSERAQVASVRYEEAPPSLWHRFPRTERLPYL